MKQKPTKLSISLFMLKIRWWIFITEIKCHLKKFFYCNWGWHKVTSGSIKTTNCKGETITTNYVRCTNCEKYFFPTKEDKDNFERIKDQEKDFFKRMFDSIVKGYNKHK